MREPRDVQPGGLGEVALRTHAGRGEHEVAVDGHAVVQPHRVRTHCFDRYATDVACAGGSDQSAQPLTGLGAEPLVLR